MLRNYLSAALRNLARNKLYSTLNTTGLAVGFAAAILIGLIVRDELTFDRFIPGYRQVHRLSMLARLPGQSPMLMDAVNADLAPALKLDFPAIETIARLASDGPRTLRHGQAVFDGPDLYWADPELFRVLPLPAIAGNLQTALDRPDGIVISRSIARKYFGRDDPVGETLEILRSRYTAVMKVTAVIEDLPSNTHLDLDVIASGRSAHSLLTQLDAQPQRETHFSADCLTYLRLREGASPAALAEAFPRFIERHWEKAPHASFALLIRPLAGIHLAPAGIGATKAAGNTAAVYGLAAIGLLILLVAAINFVNLATARAARRAVEVGVRKVSGATRGDLIVQFIGESLLYAFCGMLLAIVLVELTLPAVNALLDRTMHFDYWRDGWLSGAIVALMLVIAALGGVYPAIILAQFRPAIVLKSIITLPLSAGTVRQALVLLQFAILIALLLATTVIWRQTGYALNEGMRLEHDQVVLGWASCKPGLTDVLRSLPGVRAAACSAGIPRDINIGAVPVKRADGTLVTSFRTSVDFGFFELFGLEPVAGRFFSREHGDAVASPDASAERHAAVVINETAAHRLGFASAHASIGRTLGESPTMDIIGVAPDFPVGSIRDHIEPMIYTVDPAAFVLVWVKLTGRRIPETLQAMQHLWKVRGENLGRFEPLFFEQYLQGLCMPSRITSSSALPASSAPASSPC